MKSGKRIQSKNTTKNKKPTAPTAEGDVEVITGPVNPQLGPVDISPAALAKLKAISLKADYVLLFHDWLEGRAIDQLNVQTS